MHINVPVILKMTIDLANILDRNCCLQSIKISKFSGEQALNHPLQLAPPVFKGFIIGLKISHFYIFKRLDSLQSHYVAIHKYLDHLNF